MKLVVIEGAGKKDSIKKFLGSGYEVFPTKGHVVDLPKKTLAVSIEKNFEPSYTTMPDKKDIEKTLKLKAKTADEILLATDPDREGEAISWHIARILGIDETAPVRIVFNEISKKAIEEALKVPRAINLDLVDAYQARRVLDRLVGYKLSPYLNKKISGAKLSAGRVQSATLKIVVDREEEIRNFKPEEYWNIALILSKKNDKNKKNHFKAALAMKDGKKIKIENKEQSDEVLAAVEKAKIIIQKIKESVTSSKAAAPYITSTMQQDALNKLGMSLARSGKAAQELYEGVSFKGEKLPLVTYIRTDSTRISDAARTMAYDHIKAVYGQEFIPEKPNFFKTKKNTQDAHEAIRPIDLAITPEYVKTSLSQDQYKLYKLIYNRFVASQMTDALFNSMAVEIEVGVYTFKVNGKTPKFAGWQAVYEKEKTKKSEEEETPEGEESDAIVILPPLSEGEVLDLIEKTGEQKFTKPKPRFTEASLIKMMEEKGIGRPATYKPTLQTLFSRLYVEKFETKFIIPTKLGEMAIEVLLKNFENILDSGFTADMEERLDDIEDGGKAWQEIVGEFYNDFEKRLVTAGEDKEKLRIEAELTGEMCEKCGKPYAIRNGRFGKFVACTGYPECKNIKNTNKVVAKCPKCQKDVQERKSKRGAMFYGCTGYPECDFISWNIPTGEKCPACSDFMVIKETKKETRVFCPNKECAHPPVVTVKTETEE